MAVSIPNRRLPDAPPPLPPPRYFDDDGPAPDEMRPNGNGSRGGRFEHSKRSSGADLSFPKGWGPNLEDRRLPDRLDFSRRPNSDFSVGSLNSPTDSDRRYEAARPFDEGYYSVSGPFSQQLPGEKQLHHWDQEKSSQAYDQNIVSKIGKPGAASPRHNSTIGSLESSPTSVLSFQQRHPSQFRSLSFPNSSFNGSDPPIKPEPSSARFGDSPRSTPLSPGSLPSAPSGKSYPDYRSPTIGNSSRSSTIDSDTYTQCPQRFPSSNNVSRQQKSRRSGSGSLLSQFDESAYATPNPVKREKYDPPIFSEPDSTLPMEETVRHLHLEDRSPHTSHPDPAHLQHPEASHLLRSQPSKPGMKRKQPPEPTPDNPQMRAALMQQAASAEQYSNNASSQLLTASQTPGQYGQHQGSISSQSSSGQRHNSYASSGGPSAGESSFTSHDQHSPGPVSPTSDPHLYPPPHNDLQHNPFAVASTPQNARSGPYPQQTPESRTTPTQKSHDSSRKQSAPNLNLPFQCQCCPKKPKKFATQADLDQHQGEKNYTCHFCHNKFKNKNEAERHQNSIHKRTSSWSCAVLANDPRTAFFPTANIPPNPSPTQPHPQAPNGMPDSDVCGYCGEEFANNVVDWEQRRRHLISSHKFGDCNQSKKFYRADHFRQHLKHSHGGKSGKHTNMLEQACARDEPPQLPSDHSQSSTQSQAASAPVANMGNIGLPTPMAHASMSLPDLGPAHHAQMQHLNQQVHMRPPPPMDMIDPNIHYATQQSQAGHMQDPIGGVGYGYKPENP